MVVLSDTTPPSQHFQIKNAGSDERETRQCTALAPIAHRNCPAVPRQRSAFVGEATRERRANAPRRRR
jgi:hypothetical protein